MKPALALLMICTSYFTAAQNIAVLRAQLNTAPPGPGKIKLYKDLSSFYEDRQVDSAAYFIGEGLKLAGQLKDIREQAILLLQLGAINEKSGNTEVAGKLVMEALSILRELKDKEGIAMAYAELGLVEGKKSRGKLAGQDLDRAMQLFTASHDTAHIVQTLSELGMIYKDRGDINQALNYYLEAVKRYGAMAPATKMYLGLLDQIGKLYILKGEPGPALHYLQEGIRKSEDAVLSDTETQMLDDEGRVYENLGQKKQALGIYKQELRKAREGRLPFDQARALVSIAGILKTQSAKASLTDLGEALRIASGLEDKHLAATIYKAIAGVYAQEKNYSEAILALDEHHRLLDSLFGTDKAKELGVLDRSYELVETREQVEELQVSNKRKSLEMIIGFVVTAAILVFFTLFYFYLRKVRRLNKALENSNSVKDKLFSVLGHDLRGPVSAAVQLAGMLENGDIEASRQKKLLGTLRKQSAVTLETLESVLEWGKVQLKGIEVKPERLEAGKAIDKNLGLLERQAHAKDVRLVNNIGPDLVLLTDPGHFNLVIRNLLSNAIKFSHPKGNVTVSAANEGLSAIISVRDEGIGITPEKLKQFKSFGMATSFGTKGEKGTGLGLLLAKEFIEAEGGSIWAESEQGKGTVFYFTVKLNPN